MKNSSEPVVVMGGGPAAVFTACGLVDLGMEAVIITRPRPFPAWEGISERPLNTLRHFGFNKTLASVGPMVARAAHWNGVSQLQNREYILDRQLFDQALLADAHTKGVTVIDGRVEQMTRNEGQWHLSYVTASGTGTLTTDFLVEGRGRESKLGRKMTSGPETAKGDHITGPATTALLKSYHVSEGQAAMTSVASFVNGWAWYLRDGKGTAILQIFVSSLQGELPPKSGLEAYFTDLVSQLPEAEDWLQDVEDTGTGVSVRTAAAQKTTPCGGEDFLVVGDGALALDPLSGNGIFYAIGSGLAAAPVINTLRHKPENGDLALQFYQERIELAFEGGCLMGREFYAAEERWPTAPFWQARSSWPTGEGSSHPDPLSQPAEVCWKPVVRDGYIDRQQVIVTADHPRGVWQLDGVPLVGLLNLIRGGSRDDGDNAVKLAGATQAVTTARKWLMARKLVL
ncbi:MAG: tryptophan 7-halogenase [Rhodobacteraceae bacterium]|nr:tryptophan 7-halogenase [Paracoccaceae bacterium]